ncbi:MAG: hypothetical protein WD448_07555, partial [Woeseia sp.]
QAIDETVNVGTDGTTVDVVFTTDANITRVEGSFTIGVDGFITLSGDVVIEQVVTETETKLLIGASNVETFLGNADETLGVRLSDGFLGLVILSSGSGPTTYAMTAGGSAELVGIEGLTLIGSPQVAINTTGKAINETINVGGGASVQILFTTTADVQRLSGQLTIEIANFVALSGNFTFEKQTTATTTKLLIAANGITAFIGIEDEEGNEEIGLKIKNGTVGIVLFRSNTDTESKYALIASGDAALVGLDGLQIEGSLGIELNRSGQAIDETIVTSSGNIDIEFSSSDEVQKFSGSISLTISGVFNLSGTLEAIKMPSGLLVVDIPDMSMSILSNDEEVFGISAAARFSINPIDGFALLDMRMKSFSIFGFEVEVSEPGLELPNLPQPPPPGSTTTDGSGSTGAAPTAILAYPADGDSLDTTILNAKGYIDITFQDQSGEGLDHDTITDPQSEIAISGTAVGDAVISSMEFIGNDTYRFRFSDTNPGNDTKMFKDGTLNVSVVANTFADNAGTVNEAQSNSVTLLSGQAAGTTTIAIGPLKIVGPTVGIVGFGFKAFDDDGELAPRITITIGIGADVASLDFGASSQTEETGTDGTGSTGGTGTTSGTTSGSDSGINITLGGLLGTFDIALDLDPDDLFSVPDFSLTGRFTISIDTLTIIVPEVLEVVGTGINFVYDPAASEDEELLRVTSLTVKILPLDLTGALNPFTRDDGTTIPGLSVRGNGFTLGSASIKFEGEIAFSTILSIRGIAVGINDLDVTFGEEFVFNGEIFIAADEATLFQDSPINLSLKDGPDLDTEAVRATLTFSGGTVDGFKFQADQLEFNLFVLTIRGQGIMIDSTAGPNEEVASFVSLGAELRAGPLQIGGSMRNFAFTGDGSFKTKPGFGVFLSVSGANGSSVGWPSWMPIRITELGITWEDINEAPEDFVLIFSGSISSIYNLPLKVSGGVSQVKVDVGLLLDGEFPIIDIGGFSVTVSGNLFGMRINGGLLAGILKLTGNETDGFRQITIDDPADTPVVDRIFFAGIQAGLDVAGYGGFTIRIGLTELGPLGVFIDVAAPVLLDVSGTTGIAITNFTASVQFFKSLPTISEPEELRRPEFGSQTDMDAGAWLENVQEQVVAQFNAVQENPNLGGFIAAFTEPLTISGGATLFSMYLSRFVFSGEVEMQISTDGKFLLRGQLNFFGGLLSMSAKLYIDGSQIASGGFTILFLADIPDQFRFLTLKGKFQMGFTNNDGETVTFSVQETRDSPAGFLYAPSDGGSLGLGEFESRELDGNRYIDVQLLPSNPEGSTDEITLDLDSIMDADAEISVTTADGTELSVDGTPEQLVDLGDNFFRYKITDTDEASAGDLTINFIGSSFADSEGRLNEPDSQTFSLILPRMVLTAPSRDRSISQSALNNSGYIGVQFIAPPGQEIDEATLTDSAPEFSLTGPGTGNVTIDGSPELVDGIWRYSFSGEFEAGPVTLEIIEGSFADGSGSENDADNLPFTVHNVTADLASPADGTGIDVAVINERGYIDVTFRTPEDATLDAASVSDDAAEFTLTGTAAAGVVVDGAAEHVEGDTWRYHFTGEFTTGNVSLDFVADSWGDDQGNLNLAETEEFSLLGATAALEGDISSPFVSLTIINDRAYLDVRFSPSNGADLDVASILDEEQEFSISGDGAGTATIDGAPEQIGDDVFRYGVDGPFDVGKVTVTFIAGSFTDSAGNDTIGGTAEFSLVAPTMDLVSPALEEQVDRLELNDQGYIDVVFNDPEGLAMDEASITDSDAEFTLSGPGVEGNVPVVINGAAEKIDDFTYRYFFSGSFEDGAVQVNVIAGSFKTASGGGNLEEIEGFTVVSSAASFEILIEGGLFYMLPVAIEGTEPAPGEEGTTELFGVEGKLLLRVDQRTDDQGNVTETRFTLDFFGTMRLIYLGNIASITGRFILVAPADDLPQFWGVISLETNFEKLQPLGIELDVFATLQINVTNQERVETITLEG